MLAGAVRTYTNRYAVTPGQHVAVFTNNHDGWRTAQDLVNRGIDVSAVIDSRPIPSPVHIPGASVVMGGEVAATTGRLGLSSITLTNGQSIRADCLAVSGGWNPNVHLTCHQRGRPRWDESIAAFVPGDDLPPGMSVAGAANGALSLSDALRSADEAVQVALKDLGLNVTATALPATSEDAVEISAFWRVKDSAGRVWVDWQNDVTTKDIAQSRREGFHAVEHLKRYTTLGMATDQGKTANVLGLAIMAELAGKTITDTGTTIFRPPYTPVPIAAFAGRSRGKEFRPTRKTPSHHWAEEQGAVFVEVGAWLRAQWFPEFLNRVYANTFNTLAVGKVRYGLMLREDGIAMDDGTTARLGEHHYVMTTTTANAVSVFRHMEFCRQCLWPNLDVHLISATISNEAFPFMACGRITVCGGTAARLFRISFSGELAYEIAVPARFGDSMIRALMEAGKDYDVVPYGTEALGVMRVEKGHAAGNELNGTTTALNLGLGRMVSKKKDCIGNVLSEREGLNTDDAVRLVGFKPVEPGDSLAAGSHFVSRGAKPTTANDEGWMSSVVFSPSLNSSIGIGFLQRGHERLGEIVTAVNPVANQSIDVEVVSAHFIDPDGERLRA